MHKSKWLFFTLLLAAAFILLSLFFVHKLLKTRENTLLSGKGTIKQDSPVSGGLMKEKGEKVVLTPEEVQAIMKNWDMRIGVVVHEPVEGQITMKEAVKAVDEWLPKMGLSDGILSGNNTVYSSLSIARIKGEKLELLSPIYSFWEVAVNGDKLAGTFYVNSVTGQIFEAHVTLVSEITGVTKEQLLKSFIRLAGLKPEEQKKSDEVNEAVKQGGKAVIASAEKCFNFLLEDVAYEDVMVNEAALTHSAAEEADLSLNKDDWSISAKIADSSMTAKVNCFHYMEYADFGTEYTDKYSKKVTSQKEHIELVFNLLVEE